MHHSEVSVPGKTNKPKNISTFSVNTKNAKDAPGPDTAHGLPSVPAVENRVAERGQRRGVSSKKLDKVSVFTDNDDLKRKAWAHSLGRGMKTQISNEDCIGDAPPLSYGLWDIVDGKRPRKRVRASKMRADSMQPFLGHVFPTSTSQSIIPFIAQTFQSVKAPLLNSASMPSTSASSAMSRYARRPLAQDAAVARSVSEGGERTLDKSWVPRVRKLNVTLQGFIEQRLKLEKSIWNHLSAVEGRLRRRCLRDRLCQRAQTKYVKVSCWETYLESVDGRREIAQWVSRKVQESTKTSLW